MEPEGSSPYSQEPTTGSHPELPESNPYPPILFTKLHYNIILHLLLVLPSGLFNSGFFHSYSSC
jgi:hypothetical protein